ncbi:MAG: hypothetical protein IJ679_09405 [Lachnospiraceae bacterium]|nr:hypothetical protein [Lachnospiraceae bacterium]
MTNKKRIVRQMAAVFIAASLVACGQSGTKADPSADSAQEDGPSSDEVLEDYTKSVEDTLKEHFGANFKVERDGLFINASVWSDGMAKIAEDASAGDEAQQQKWDEELKSLLELSKELGISMEATGVKNGHAVLSLMDETNLDRMLAMLSEDVVIFDEVASNKENEAANNAENATENDDNAANAAGAESEETTEGVEGAEEASE